jgi:hypothetical protein
MKQAWVIVEGTKPIGIALDAAAMEAWLDAHPAACAVRVPHPDAPDDEQDGEGYP